MAMEKQMEMFALGGLDDDGLSRDPVSGNEIPPGSMANEVRDDVEARLSDGEYVVPAKVVRFFGVKFFEDLRTQAMRGLGAMEANGRIGGEPVPSDMPMQDQMAQTQNPVSEDEMQMLQSMMNKGGYIQGYAHGGSHSEPIDFEEEAANRYPADLSRFFTPGGTYITSENLTPDPNKPSVPTPVDPGPSPESGISFVTMVNPATGEIQLVQFMGGNPVDANAYNQLLSNGYFVQGSPELAAYKQRMAEDNRQEPDTTTRPHPSEATISELGQLIAESSKGGGSLLEMIPGITGAVTGKLAQGHRNDITKALDTFIEKSTSVANKRAAQVMKDIWTNADLTSKQRKEAISKAGLYTGPSVKNALGKKAGKFGSENWFGLTPQDEIDKMFGTADDLEKVLKSERSTIKDANQVRIDKIKKEAEDNNQTVAETYQQDKKEKQKQSDEAEDNRQEAERQEEQANVDASGSSSQPDNSAAAYSGSVQGKEFGRAKGGLINKPTKKKKTKKY
jgi:hypothetical protein